MHSARKPSGFLPFGSTLATGAIALSLASIPSCLPSLDPSLVTGYLCHGGVPDGILDAADQGGEPAEECDDGNNDDGDGCDHTCHVECAPPAVKDPRTFHCYSIANVTPGADPCASPNPGSLGLITVRTDSEKSLLATLASTGAGPYLTAYHVSLDQAPATGKYTIDSAIAGPVYGDPGILESTTLGSAYGCSGCYYAGKSPFWASDQQTNDMVVFQVDASYSTVHASLAPTQAICETAPIGDARGCSGNCTNGATSEKRLQAAGEAIASMYSYFGEVAKIDDAEATCAGLGTGGHLLWFSSEEERELVVREFLTDLRNTRGLTFLGLRKQSGVWTWADGTPDGPPRPYFWLLSNTTTNQPPVLLLPGECAAIISPTGTSYASGLLNAIPCGGQKASSGVAAIAAQQTYMCKRPSP